MLIERFIPSLRFRRRRGSEASVSSVSRLEQVIDGRDIDPAKLARTVKEKFGTGQFSITLSQDMYILVIPKRLSSVEIDGCRFAWAKAEGSRARARKESHH
ncbi:unnamed protein product [Clonostachys rosea f. rosea IK726]|uniref:Uncharacterized protein n=1 Tax=Clonostachys rosea f. rosea IK726 TaxID=1349383 RepID=A0ACA9TP86_BIOOC|nr:unnamed protein product [Clonostachys rosea f. rosea IK726]